MNATQTARLHLDTLGSRVVTRVAQRTDRSMTVTQALPFLRLDSAVHDEEGRSARIQWVTLDIDGDTPSLVMQLAYDEALPKAAPPRAEKPRRDETVPFEIQRGSASHQVRIGRSSYPAPAEALAPTVVESPRWLEQGQELLLQAHAFVQRARKQLGIYLMVLGSRLSAA